MDRDGRWSPLRAFRGRWSISRLWLGKPAAVFVSRLGRDAGALFAASAGSPRREGRFLLKKTAHGHRVAVVPLSGRGAGLRMRFPGRRR